ncbi:hypothetical protein J6590_093954 [Homalodisca vitripennis]|nr:hypothetical protein J6590_093954 [Homalodisca vitripennis]
MEAIVRRSRFIGRSDWRIHPDVLTSSSRRINVLTGAGYLAPAHPVTISHLLSGVILVYEEINKLVPEV